MSLRDALEFALTHDLVVAHFQPQVDVVTNRVVGVEVLARWGAVPPSVFVPLAEKCGLVPLLTRNMLRQAVAAQRLCATNFSINVESTSMWDLYTTNTLATPNVMLELTERTSTVHSLVYSLNALGWKFSLDDFGVAHSNFSTLLGLPICQLKIDKLFVQHTSPTAGVVMRTISQLASTLGMECVAEGVETSQQLARVVASGCSVVQGWYFARALSLPQLQLYLEKHS